MTTDKILKGEAKIFHIYSSKTREIIHANFDELNQWLDQDLKK